jgi:hypothetical protein
MIKLVISGGDSFTFGAELETDIPHLPNPNSWANIVAERIGATHINTARSARGNSFIVRHIMHQVITAQARGIAAENILIQVMWTFANRHEFALATEHSQWDSPWFGITPYTAEDESKSDWFKRVTPDTKHYAIVKQHLREAYLKNLKIGIVDFAKHFITTIQDSALHDSYTSAAAVLQLQDFLTLRGIPHLFTYVDKSALNGIATDAHSNPGSTYLNSVRSQINFDSWYKFPNNLGFLEWARNNNYEFATSHPLESAHRDAADLIYNYINDKGYLNGNQSR